MNKNLKDLMWAISQNRKKDINDYAIKVLENSKSQADKQYVNEMLDKLKKVNLKFMELPANVSNLIYQEDVADFNENRYFLTDEDKELLETLETGYSVATKLSDMGIHYVNSVLLFGEAGTGKTTFGKYIAYKMDLPFIYMNMSYVLESYLGNSQKNIQRVFDYIRDEKCVLMIDEIDALGLSRGAHGEVGEIGRVCISLMQNLDKSNNSSIILAGTNRVTDLDNALISRFNIKKEFKKFNSNQIYNWIINYLDNINFEYSKSNIKDFSEYCETEKLSNRTIEQLLILSIADAVSKDETKLLYIARL